jgi:hypothetical protein
MNFQAGITHSPDRLLNYIEPNPQQENNSNALDMSPSHTLCMVKRHHMQSIKNQSKDVHLAPTLKQRLHTCPAGCGAFFSSGNVKRHWDYHCSHNLQKMRFVCLECPATFGRKFTLMRHSKRKHNRILEQSSFL